MNQRFLIGMLAWAGFAWVATAAWADTPLPPPAQVRACSPSGAFCAVSDPAHNQTIISRRDGGEPTWEIAGWHRWLLVTDDGKNLVIGYDGMNLLSRDDVRLDTPVLFFYNAQGLLRTVKLGDIYRNTNQLQETVSHYHWVNALSLDRAGHLIVERVDGSTVAFDPATGRVIEPRGDTLPPILRIRD